MISLLAPQAMRAEGAGRGREGCWAHLAPTRAGRSCFRALGASKMNPCGRGSSRRRTGQGPLRSGSGSAAAGRGWGGCGAW